MIGDSVIDLSVLYKFKARYGMHQTSYPMFKEPPFLTVNVARA
jgi:hypothetical protein